ncbi:hypothetical protein LSAT2_013034, partial [Lamellibrachia satsuma]
VAVHTAMLLSKSATHASAGNTPKQPVLRNYNHNSDIYSLVNLHLQTVDSMFEVICLGYFSSCHDTQVQDGCK